MFAAFTFFKVSYDARNLAFARRVVLVVAQLVTNL